VFPPPAAGVVVRTIDEEFEQPARLAQGASVAARTNVLDECVDHRDVPVKDLPVVPYSSRSIRRPVETAVSCGVESIPQELDPLLGKPEVLAEGVPVRIREHPDHPALSRQLFLVGGEQKAAVSRIDGCCPPGQHALAELNPHPARATLQALCHHQ